VHAVGALHHVMIRGIDGRAIFSAAAECEDFIARLAFLVRELGFAVLAWCLITNHAHLVLQSNEVPLAILMKRLNARHAQRHNRREARVGHVFQARYKAVLIENHSTRRDDPLCARECGATRARHPQRFSGLPLVDARSARWTSLAIRVRRRARCRESARDGAGKAARTRRARRE
jgi:REP element-mobilizing transposase RayT